MLSLYKNAIIIAHFGMLRIRWVRELPNYRVQNKNRSLSGAEMTLAQKQCTLALRLGSATLTNRRSVTRLEYAQGIFK